MHHDTPSPYGDLTRSWAQLSPAAADAAAVRLLADGTCAEPDPEHVADPGLDAGCCYARLVDVAQAGDALAVGWVATTHLPQLLRQGMWLLVHAPGDWALAAHDALTRVLFEDLPDAGGRWLRRRVAHRLAKELGRSLWAERRRRRFEVNVEPYSMDTYVAGWDPDRDDGCDALTCALLAAMDELDTATRHGLIAIASDRDPAEVADQYDLAYGTLRQRICRARPQLQARLSGHVRTVGA